MKEMVFLDDEGTFRAGGIGNDRGLYFPLTGNGGLKSVVTPDLNGDAKLDQDHFLLLPVGMEDLHNNKSGRNFWCRFQEGGYVSATGHSAWQQAACFTGQADEVTVEGGVLWHKVIRTIKGVEMQSEILSFIPIGEDMEVMQVTLRNTGTGARTFRPVGAVPIYGRSADNLRDHRHVTSLLHRIYVTGEGVCVRPALSFDERGHQVNRHTYFVTGAEKDGENPIDFFPVLDEFIGRGGSLEVPGAIVQNAAGEHAGYKAEGCEAMGGIGFAERTLLPGEQAVYLLFMGISCEESPEAITADIRRKYGSLEKVAKSFLEAKAYWAKKNDVEIHTGDRQFDRYMKWIGFQPVLRRIYGCSFLPHHDYGKGGRGWRDLWQDLLALMMVEPEQTGEALANHYQGVRMDGTNATIIGSRPGAFIADRNNIPRVWMDHGLWPFMTTLLYLHQTGDTDLLMKEVGYFKDRQVMRGTKTDREYAEAEGTRQKAPDGRCYTGTILEHMLLENLTVFFEVGEHNHMRLRGGDWNDALDLADERGESVAFTAAYAGNLDELARLLLHLKEETGIRELLIMEELHPLFRSDEALYEDIDRKKQVLEQFCQSVRHTVTGIRKPISIDLLHDSLQHKAQWLKEHIRRTAWLKEGWFNSYYDNQGRQVEGIVDNRVKMMLTGQTFAIMAGVADDEQTKQMIQNIDTWLYSEERGGYCLNTDFGEANMQLGRMFGFAYGHKENGAVFSHMTVMYGHALYQRGYVKAGYKALHTLYKQAAKAEVSGIYPGIPEYFDGQGRGLYHYLTGSASWYMLTVVTQMFGIKGHYGDLCLEPKLMAEQFDGGEASIRLTFAGKKLRVLYSNPDRLDYGHYQIATCELDGRPVGPVISGACIRALDHETEHMILATLDAVL